MRRTGIAALALLALAAGCAEDGAVSPQGGQAFETTFTAVANVRTPTIQALAFGRSVNNAAVVDSVVGEVALLKPLSGSARYQFYIVNGLDSSATPVSHTQWIIRTDSLLDANGNIRSPIDTTRTTGVRDFYAGNFFGQDDLRGGGISMIGNPLYLGRGSRRRRRRQAVQQRLQHRRRQA